MQVSMQAMSIDCLNTAKQFTITECFNTLESSSAQCRQSFSRMTQEHQSMADDWFRLMHRRGWYQVPEARPEIRTQIASFVSSMQSSMQSPFSGAGSTAQSGQFGYGQSFGSGNQYGYGQGGFGSQIYGQQSAAMQPGGMYTGSWSQHSR